jgi:hypothetical protein
MGGCNDAARPYPPPIQVCPRDDLDPSLAYDLSDYGHLGYDPLAGPPDPNGPVQSQYTGTWAMYRPASANPGVGHLLAKHIYAAMNCTPPPPTTLITLTSFDTMPGNKKITVSWTTSSEIDSAGFNIYRSTEENGYFLKINTQLIPATGSPSAGAAYEFVDSAVKNRQIYWYKLEEVELSGKITVHGPVSAMPSFFAMFSSK